MFDYENWGNDMLDS